MLAPLIINDLRRARHSVRRKDSTEGLLSSVEGARLENWCQIIATTSPPTRYQIARFFVALLSPSNPGSAVPTRFLKDNPLLGILGRKNGTIFKRLAQQVMRYLVKARVKRGQEKALLRAVADGSLGRGSIAGDEYIRHGTGPPPKRRNEDLRQILSSRSSESPLARRLSCHRSAGSAD